MTFPALGGVLDAVPQGCFAMDGDGSKQVGGAL